MVNENVFKEVEQTLQMMLEVKEEEIKEGQKR